MAEKKPEGLAGSETTLGAVKTFVQFLFRETAFAVKCVGFGLLATPVVCLSGVISLSILLLSPILFFGLFFYGFLLIVLPAPVTLVILPLAKFLIRGDDLASHWAIIIIGFVAGGLEFLVLFPKAGMHLWFRVANVLSGSIAGAVAGFCFATLVRWRRAPAGSN
jgi:hypothetical protein